MKEILEENWCFCVWERNTSQFLLYTKILKKLYKPWKYLEKSWNFALTKGEEPYTSDVVV